VAIIEAKVCLSWQWQAADTHVMYVVDNSNVMHALFLKETVRQGQYFTQPESVKQIPSFVQHYSIEMDDYVVSDVNEYKNFNEFFTRAILPSKRPIAEADNHVKWSSVCTCICILT
jgi:phosphatidylserine decarboxylase